MNYINSIDIWIELPKIKYNDYLLLQVNNDTNFVIFSYEQNSIIYRDEYIESGGNFLVYIFDDSIWTLVNEGFGSPTNIALYIGDIKNITKASAFHNIIDFTSSEIIIYK